MHVLISNVEHKAWELRHKARAHHPCQLSYPAELWILDIEPQRVIQILRHHAVVQAMADCANKHGLGISSLEVIDVVAELSHELGTAAQVA